MKTAKEIRSEFIEFFKNKEHIFVSSAPVVPHDDPTLLFTNAGMNQFKSIFLGDNPQKLKRVANSQKCMRVSGKHNDLEEVGVDHHHHTFFEMLGNWSFGDYYKKEAIRWAWELLTDVWKLPKDKLYATVYEDDNESFEIWKTVTDIDPTHIERHGAKDNFWEMGETGPCGPSSEIHLDTGEGTCIFADTSDHRCAVNADSCGRFIELWNLVFIQYDRKKDKTLNELPLKHVDTGMGFERIVRVLQNVNSNYSSDIFMPIISRLEEMSSKKYEFGSKGIPFRVIADHIRSLVFAITDGAFPSNDGRGYVLRRILRRAYRFGSKLGFNKPFLCELVDVVIDNMGDIFPEITQRRDYVVQIIKSEEERFAQTLSQGEDRFLQMANIARTAKNKVLNGNDVFSLYDTYGFPMDLTRLMAQEIGLAIDEKGFAVAMIQQKSRARSARGSAGKNGLSPDGWIELKKCDMTKFVGYDNIEATASVCRYKITKSSLKGTFDNALFVLDQTPFYAEMGGQAGDTGMLTTEDNTIILVDNTIKWNDTTVHNVSGNKIDESLFFDKTLIAKIKLEQRTATQRNHSATHLLQAALTIVLGNHVTQSGSRVAHDIMRFDFTHFHGMSNAEIIKVENLVNEWIMNNLPVVTKIKNIDDAKASGATAIFGEKYGDTVRVVSMGDNCIELCGGTHVSSTGNIGLFHIVSESSISAGIRRIEAVTGSNLLSLLCKKEIILADSISLLKIPEDKLVCRIEEITSRVKYLDAEITKLSLLQATQKVEDLFAKADKNEELFPLVIENIGMSKKEQFVAIVDAVSDTIKSKTLVMACVVLAANVDGKALFAASAGKKAVLSGIHCGNIVKVAAKKACGGGGGTPFRAQAGGKNGFAIDDALAIVRKLIEDNKDV